MGKVATYLTFLRIPGLGGLAIPPVIAALTVGVTDLFSLILLFLVGSFSIIFGFILNDYVDVEVDRLSKDLQTRPLVSGAIPSQNVVWICFTCVILTFVCLGFLFYGKVMTDYRIAAVLVIALAYLLGSIYDYHGKKIVASDIIIALAIALVFLTGALAVSMPLTIFTWIVFILTFNNLLHMNAVEGGIKDADHDYKKEVKNLAYRMGVRVRGNVLQIPLSFKIFSMSIRVFSVLLLFVPFFIFHQPFYLWQLIILGLACCGVLIFSLRLLFLTTFDRKKIRKFISIQSFLRYSLVPLMLLSIIGFTISIILIVLPIVWYLIFTPFTGDKFLQPRM